MCDTYKPLKLSTWSKDIDNLEYMFSWYQEPTATKPEEAPTIA